jgi:ubiquinone/menaquinone biosynthesis C-methylase UbiE
VVNRAGERSVAVTAKKVLRPVARAVRWLAAVTDTDPTPAPPRGATYDRSEWVNEGIAADGLPIPPRTLWRTAHNSFEDFTKFGEEAFAQMLDRLAAQGWVPSGASTVLDFGSGSGRFVRLWGDRVGRVWGCDLNSDQIRWCQEFLSPKYSFVRNETSPHLAFEDGTFDLVYAGSVFTHIDQFADAWLLEIRRVLQPGGYFYVTFSDEHTWDFMQAGDTPMEWSRVLHPAGQSKELPADFVALADGPGSNVFYRREYFEKFAREFFEVCSITPHARGYQAAAVLKKPS